MHQLSRPAVILLAAASLAFGAPSKEMIQLQRDIAQLQDQVRQLQGAMNERLVALTTLVQQALDTSSKTNTSVAVLESGLRDRLSQQLSAPITSVSTKVDQMSTEFQGVRENVSAMNETLAKLQQQLVDLNSAVKILQAPPAPPPGAASGIGAPGSGAPTGPPAGMSAQQLYQNALADRSRGNFDLALQGFQEYLKWFDNTELAPNAQFYVGQIAYDKTDFPAAIEAFNLVVEKYGENNKSADATYMKGMALLKSGQRTQAGQEFLTVIQKYPNSEVAPKARTQRQALGLSVPKAAAPTKPAARRKR
jgi:tol-pal system protein YbgF